MHPARIWKPISDDRCQCRLCSHFCIIEPGRRGQCGVRENQGGELRTLVYDRVAALNMDPVEKKPLYHFQPGTMTFSLGTQGCNFSCVFCQNDSLSQPPRTERQAGRSPSGQEVTPLGLVQAALRHGAASISYTYSEPTVFFELMLDTAALAHEHGLKNIMVSNGFQSEHCLEALNGHIDAANIDLKAFSEDFYRERCGARLAPVLDTLKTIKAMGWWLEVTTLVIPGLNDDPDELTQLAGFIAGRLGTDTPWHLSRFHPQYKLRDRPSTPMSTLEAAHALGREAGLDHVYIGNVPGNEHANTPCPACGRTVLTRMGFSSKAPGLRNGACAHCGHVLAGVWNAKDAS